MSVTADNYLRALNDAFTPVRETATGRLLGCVPKVREDEIMVGPFPLIIAAQVCVAVDLDSPSGADVASLPGFIPLDDTQTDLLIPVAQAEDDL